MKPRSSSGKGVEDEEEEEGASCLNSQPPMSDAWAPPPAGSALFNSATFLRTAALYRLDDLLPLKMSCSALAAADRGSLLRAAHGGEGGKRLIPTPVPPPLSPANSFGGYLRERVVCPLVAVQSLLQEAEAVLSRLKQRTCCDACEEIKAVVFF